MAADRMTGSNDGSGVIDGIDVQGPTIKVRFWRDDRIIQTVFIEGESLYELLKRLNVRPDGALVMSSGTPLPLDDPVTTGSELTIIDVRSGG